MEIRIDSFSYRKHYCQKTPPVALVFFSHTHLEAMRSSHQKWNAISIILKPLSFHLLTHTEWTLSWGNHLINFQNDRHSVAITTGPPPPCKFLKNCWPQTFFSARPSRSGPLGISQMVAPAPRPPRGVPGFIIISAFVWSSVIRVHPLPGWFVWYSPVRVAFLLLYSLLLVYIHCLDVFGVGEGGEGEREELEQYKKKFSATESMTGSIRMLIIWKWEVSFRLSFQTGWASSEEFHKSHYSRGLNVSEQIPVFILFYNLHYSWHDNFASVLHSYEPYSSAHENLSPLASCGLFCPLVPHGFGK